MSFRETWIGWSILAVGLIHSLVGLAVFGHHLSEMAGEGLWNAVDGHPGRPVAFWFMMSGVCLILLGLAIAALQRTRIPVPTSLTWIFAAMVAAAVIAMPMSGAWLLVPPAIGLAMRAIRRRPANTVAKPDPLS